MIIAICILRATLLVLYGLIAYYPSKKNPKFWRAPIGRNRSCDAIVGAYQRIVPVFAQNLTLYNKNNRVLLS